eukprot:125630-Pelagomonas_calceolata.AAC.1
MGASHHRHIHRLSPHSLRLLVKRRVHAAPLRKLQPAPTRGKGLDTSEHQICRHARKPGNTLSTLRMTRAPALHP